MRDVPDGLVVEVDDAGVHVELGPPPPRMVTVATAGSVILSCALIVLAGLFHLTAIQIALAVVGVFGVATLRMIEFGRNEAALTLSADEHALTLTRHHRRRVFRKDRYLLENIGGCTAIEDGLKLELPGGSQWLKTRFRSDAQNQWVAELVRNAIDKQRAHADERRLDDTTDIAALVRSLPGRP